MKKYQHWLRKLIILSKKHQVNLSTETDYYKGWWQAGFDEQDIIDNIQLVNNSKY